jgi:DNA-binding transcriptional MerR regulator
MVMKGARLTISQLAAQVGMAPSALRYYEEARLIKPTERSPSGYRLYGPEVAGRIRFIQRATALGLKLSEVRYLIETSHGAAESEKSILAAVITRKLEETRLKMANLTNQAHELLRAERRLRLQPPPDCCYLGDCTCWFPGVA